MIGKIIKYAKSYARLMLLKIKYGKRFHVERGGEKPVYIGANCTIDIGEDAKIYIRRSAYLDNGCVLQALTGAMIEIGEGAYLNTGCRIYAMNRILIGNHCMFGSNVAVYDHEHDLLNGVFESRGSYRCEPVYIGDNVWCCTNVVITAGCTIGSNVAVGANAVVTKSLESNAIYGGVPAKYIKPIVADIRS